MAKSRIELRREHEAAESREGAGDAAPKTRRRAKAAEPAVRKKRVKEKPTQRKRLMWGVFNANMKEEARFPYDQRQAAEDRADQLRAKSKKLYFIQPIKEVIGEPSAPAKPKAEKIVPVTKPARDLDELAEDEAPEAEDTGDGDDLDELEEIPETDLAEDDDLDLSGEED